MKVRMMWVVLLAVAAGAGAVAQPFDPSTGSGSSRATSRDDTLRAARERRRGAAAGGARALRGTDGAGR